MVTSQKIVILDNGAHQIKAEYHNASTPKTLPNAIFKTKSDRKRVYVADELEECHDRAALYFVVPFERGYLVNWDVQLQIWDRLFGKECLNVDFQDSKLMLTDPSDIAKAVRDVSLEVAFETYQFESFLKTSAPSCVAHDHYCRNLDNAEESCCLVVDSGHSFTHIIPYIEGKIVGNGVVRIDVGGKALTNQLKEWISYRQLNVLEETYVMNQCKEDVCFVSTDLENDLKKCIPRFAKDGTLRRNYILPNFVDFHRGVVQEPQKHCDNGGVEDRARINIGVERFLTPEILFSPDIVDINQMGIAEAIHYSLSQLPEEFRYLLLKNIILVGGNALFPGFKERIEHDLRPFIADYFDFCVRRPDDPIRYAWQCASNVITNYAQLSDGLCTKFVTRTDFAEHGPNICRTRFYNYYSPSF